MTQNQYKILIVEDNPSDRALLTGVLKNMDPQFDITSVGSYEEAKAEFERSVPDLVLLNLYLPDKDGFDFLQEFHKNNFRDIPVIIVSSSEDEKDKLKGFEFGAVDFVTKPIVTVDVRARVAVQLRLKKIKDDYEWASR